VIRPFFASAAPFYGDLKNSPSEAIGRPGHSPAFADFDQRATDSTSSPSFMMRRSRVPRERLSYRKIAKKLCEAGFKNEHGTPYNSKSVRAMVMS
jgi:hypothetical protein